MPWDVESPHRKRKTIAFRLSPLFKPASELLFLSRSSSFLGNVIALSCRSEHQIPAMNLANLKRALIGTYDDVVDNHTLQMAAALAYYFVLSLFPALIFLSSIVAYLPVPDLFNQGLNVMGRFLPADTMGLVRKILADVISPNRGAFLSFGLLGILWTASGGFAAAIEALNMAYDVEDDRPFWKTRPLEQYVVCLR